MVSPFVETLLVLAEKSDWGKARGEVAGKMPVGKSGNHRENSRKKLLWEFAGQMAADHLSSFQHTLSKAPPCVLSWQVQVHVYNKLTCSGGTVGTKIIADPEKCFQELISEKLLILLRDWPSLELIIVSSNFQALLLLQEKLLESV